MNTTGSSSRFRSRPCHLGGNPGCPSDCAPLVVSLSNYERMNTFVGLPLTPFDKLRVSGAEGHNGRPLPLPQEAKHSVRDLPATREDEAVARSLQRHQP